jgi:death-on-curing protein
MIKLSEEKVMYLHNVLIEQTGGNPSIRDRGLLNSALEGAYQTFGGVELYPTVEEKGARLGYSLISNHAFIDGNKRIGMLIMFVFLEINGVRLNPTNEEFARVGLAVAAGQMKYEELLLWVQESKV